jgi:inhibitor of KinA sporulation pathway (predicted exonuclease)
MAELQPPLPNVNPGKGSLSGSLENEQPQTGTPSLFGDDSKSQLSKIISLLDDMNHFFTTEFFNLFENTNQLLKDQNKILKSMVPNRAAKLRDTESTLEAGTGGAVAGGRSGASGGGGKGKSGGLLGGLGDLLKGGMAAVASVGITALAGSLTLLTGAVSFMRLGPFIKGALALAGFLAIVGGTAAGVTWLVGKAAETVGSGFTAIGKGLKDLEAGLSVLKSADTTGLVQIGSDVASFMGKFADFKTAKGAIVGHMIPNMKTFGEGITALSDTKVNEKNMTTIAKAVNSFLTKLSGDNFWDAGKGLVIARLIPGLTSLAKSVTTISDTKVNEKNMTTVAEAVNSFLTRLSGDNFWEAGKGAIIARLIPGLTDLEKSVTAMSNITVNKENMTTVADSIHAFLARLSDVGIWTTIKSAITDFVMPSLSGTANAVTALSTATVDKKKMLDIADGLTALNSPLSKFSGVGFKGNFVGSESITDISKGITALNKTEVDKQKMLDMAGGLTALNPPLAKITKTGFIGNFVGSESLADVSKGITALNKTEVTNLAKVSEGIKHLDGPFWEIVKTGLAGNFVGDKALTDIAHGITTFNNVPTKNIGAVSAAIKTLNKEVWPLVKTGLFANFVGKQALTDLADAVAHSNEKLGDPSQLEAAQNAAKVFGALKGVFSDFAEEGFMAQLTNLGTTVIGWFTSDDTDPLKVMKKYEQLNGEKIDQNIKSVKNAYTQIQTLGGLKFDKIDNKAWHSWARRLEEFGDTLDDGESVAIQQVGEGLKNIQQVVIDQGIRPAQFPAPVAAAAQGQGGDTNLTNNTSSNSAYTNKTEVNAPIQTKPGSLREGMRRHGHNWMR